MASEASTTARDAALRQLLVDQVNGETRTSVTRPHPGSTGGPVPERRRLRATLVTGLVSTAVIASSVAALVLSAVPRDAPAERLRQGARPDGITSSSPSPSRTTKLIGHAGWREVTRAQLHEYVSTSATLQRDPANAEIWEEQAWLDIRCMASQGYLYDPIRDAQDEGRTAGDGGLTTQQLRGFNTALWGPPSDGPYDWRTAGCHGRSVHETGQDNAH